MTLKSMQWLAVMALAALSGCSTFTAAPYAASGQPREPGLFKAEGGVQLGSFQAGSVDLTEIMCRRVGPVKPPNGLSFTEYVRVALAAELQSPQVSPAAKPVVLTGKLDAIDFSTVDDYWSVKVTLRSNNGTEATFSSLYPYRASWYGNKACEQAAEALAPALRQLALDIRKHADFRKLVQPAR